MYYLVIIIGLSGQLANVPPVIHHMEFDTQDACQAAKKRIYERYEELDKKYRDFSISCYEKGLPVQKPAG